MAEDAKRARHALRRIRTRLSSVAALRAAGVNTQPVDPSQFGYEADALVRQDSLRSHFGAMVDAAVARSQIAKPSDAEHDTLTRPPMTKEEKRFSRGLLGTVARFHRTSRGVCVRSGDPRHEEWGRVKTADLKLTYALYLLENDMGHYRHLYREAERAERVGGRLKYYQAPAPSIRIPELWLEFPELAAAQDMQQPPVEWRPEKQLGAFPELWRSLHAARWPDIEVQTAKRKVAKTPAPKAPVTTVPANATTTSPPGGDKVAPPAGPGKQASPEAPSKAAPSVAPAKAASPAAPGKAAAPPPASSKAAPPPAPSTASPGKAAPPPAPAGKTMPLAPSQKAAPHPAPGKTGAAPAPAKALPPPAASKAPPPAGKGGPPPAVKKAPPPPPKKA